MYVIWIYLLLSVLYVFKKDINLNKNRQELIPEIDDDIIEYVEKFWKPIVKPLRILSKIVGYIIVSILVIIFLFIFFGWVIGLSATTIIIILLIMLLLK